MADNRKDFGVFRIFLALAILYCFFVHLVTSKNTIVTKFEFPSDCVDSDGNPRAHLENWTTSATSCDHHTCYSVLSDTSKVKVSQSCDASVVASNPDPANCNATSNDTLTFPHCCPNITCAIGVLPNNTPAACSDLSPPFACQFWKNETQCTDSVNSILHFLYNLTLEYCRQTCGYCT